MADLEAQLRGLVYNEARKRRRSPEWWWGSGPNSAGIGRQLDLSQATVDRILYGRPYRRGASLQRPRSSEIISPEVLEAIRSFYDLPSIADAFEMIENSESVGPLPRRSKRRKAS